MTGRRDISPATILLVVGTAVLPQIGNQLGQDLGWGFNLPLAGAGLVAAVWAALRTRHAARVSRWGFVSLAAIYVMLIASLAAVPNAPAIWIIVPPIAIWATAAQLLIGRPWHASPLRKGLREVFGVALLGFGVAAISFSVGLLANEEWFLGLTGFACGGAIVAGGVEELLWSQRGLGRGWFALGLFLIAAGIVGLFVYDPWLAGFMLLLGLFVVTTGALHGRRNSDDMVLLVFGLVLCLLGISTFGAGNWQWAAPTVGLGAAGVMGAIAGLRGHEFGARLAMAGTGIAILGAGVGALLRGDVTFGLAMLGIGIVGVFLAILDPAPLAIAEDQMSEGLTASSGEFRDM